MKRSRKGLVMAVLYGAMALSSASIFARDCTVLDVKGNRVVVLDDEELDVYSQSNDFTVGQEVVVLPNGSLTSKVQRVTKVVGHLVYTDTECFYEDEQQYFRQGDIVVISSNNNEAWITKVYMV